MQIILGPMSLLLFFQTRGTLLCGVKWHLIIISVIHVISYFPLLPFIKEYAILSSIFQWAFIFKNIHYRFMDTERFTVVIVDWLPITIFPYFHCLPEISISILPLDSNCTDDHRLLKPLDRCNAWTRRSIPF
jgi:hypothetical protein